MRKLTLFVSAILLSIALSAQDDASVYNFTVVKENPITSIKNQQSTSTCWSFSGVGFLESELIRMGKGTFDLSEMYIVRRNYEDKAKKYVRLHGNLNFAPGGSFADVIETIDEFGLIPNDVYEGLNYGSDSHNHGEMDKVLSGYMEGLAKANGLSTAWYNGFTGIMDSYLGEAPEKFMYNGKEYTPHSFADMLGIKESDYVSFTSYTHQPFYTGFALEIPDNWRWAISYNLPIDEMMSVIDEAIMKGYTIAWASDVSEAGFSRSGIAVMPDENAPENAGTDQAKWLGLSSRQKDVAMRDKIGREILKEKSITQEMRQEAFDNFETTDDHGMQIYGIAKDQNGNKYYMVKNSWGETGPYKGLWYVSEPFMRYKTMSIVVNKGGVPTDIAKKTGL